MAKQTLLIGTINAGGGDTLPEAMDKVNDNFDELYSITFIPDQVDFAGSMAFGNGLRNLEHVTADDGQDNITIGDGAGQSLTTGRANVLIGTNNGRDMTGSDTVNGYSGTLGNCGNTWIGRTIGAVANGALDNSYVGGNAAQNLTNGMDNAGVGVATQRNIEGGSENATLGHGTIEYVVGSGDFATGTGHRLTAVGDMAARFLNSTANKTGGKASVYIGAQTRSASNTAFNENVFGYGAEGAGDNSVVIGSDTVTKTLLKGYVGIGVATPLMHLHVKGEASSAGVIGLDVTTAGTDPYLQFMEGGSSAWRVGMDTSDGYKFKFAYGAIGSEDKVSITSAGNVGIGTSAPNANAILDLTSTTKAFIPPRMTTAQRDAIASPTAGMAVFNSTTGRLNLYTTAWSSDANPDFRNDSSNTNTFINCVNTLAANQTYLADNVRGVIVIGPGAAANGEYLNDCVYIGSESGRNNVGQSTLTEPPFTIRTLVGNTACGRLTLAEGLHPTNCTAFGDSALRRVEAGASGSGAFGYVCMENLTTGLECNAFGRGTNNGLVSGDFNNSFGNAAGFTNVEHSRNNWFGYYAGQLNTSNDNTGMGHFVFYNLTGHANGTGENTGLGANAGFTLAGGFRNTFLGANAGNNVSQKVDASNSMAIGYLTYTDKDNQVVIGNSSVTETVLRGNVLIPTATVTTLVATTATPIMRSLVTSMPAGGADALQFGSGAATMSILWGSGVPSATAVKGSLYLRSDGSTTNDRMYINTDGGSTWTAVPTLA